MFILYYTWDRTNVISITFEQRCLQLSSEKQYESKEILLIIINYFDSNRILWLSVELVHLKQDKTKYQYKYQKSGQLRDNSFDLTLTSLGFFDIK